MRYSIEEEQNDHWLLFCITFQPRLAVHFNTFAFYHVIGSILRDYSRLACETQTPLKWQDWRVTELQFSVTGH